jgi:DNA-directed RNA polymerase specialized sigma24 family protein
LSDIDGLLDAWLHSEAGHSADSRLSELVDQTRPLIRRVVASRLAGMGEDREDVCSEVQLELLLWLRRMKTASSPVAIEDYAAYISTIAANGCNRYFRRRYRGDASLTVNVSMSASQLETVPDRTQPAEQAIDCRRYAARLWKEIGALPRRQKIALLFHLRDKHGNPALPLFQLTGTAFLPAIATAVGMSVAELAAIWNDLPLDDNHIAALLSCTRQQVINLRMSARKRLAKRIPAS